MKINDLCDKVRETAYAIHVYHGHGHLEKIYENALVHRLRKVGLSVGQQVPCRFGLKMAQYLETTWPICLWKIAY
jgi:GxxExxY protein